MSQSSHVIGIIARQDPMTTLGDSDIALVPSANGVRMIRILDDQMNSMASGLTSCERHAWMDDGRVAVQTKRQGKRPLWRRVTMLACDGQRVWTATRFETPIPATDVIAFAGRLFVRRSADGSSRLWWIDALSSRAQWHPLSMPPELGMRKDIDALAQDGRALVAIDNIVFPKWMLRYVVDADTSLNLDAVVEMDANGTYESVYSASSGGSVFTVLSRTVGRTGARDFLVIYRFDNLESLGGVEFDHARFDYAMQGDSLWLLDASRPDHVIRADSRTLSGQIRYGTHW